MEEKSLVLSLHSNHPLRVVTDFSGSLTDQSEKRLQNTLQHILQTDIMRITLNLSGLQHISATGLVSFVSFLTQLKLKKRRLVIYGMSPAVEAILRFSQIHRIARFTANESEANQAFNQNNQAKITHSPTADINMKGWAQILDKAHTHDLPGDVINLNIDDRAVTSPLQGFGRMRLRTYRVRLEGASISPEEIMTLWKRDFPRFWPTGNIFHTSEPGAVPGETCLFNLKLAGGIKLATGAVVMYADDDSFALTALQGHMFAGWIIFSSFTEDGVTVAQTQAFIRPSDPFYELSFLFGFGPKAEDSFWHKTLQNLAYRFSVNPPIEQNDLLLDRHLQWQYIHNVWYNAGIRTALYQIVAPLRWINHQFRKRSAN